MYSWYRAVLAYPATLWQTRKPSGAPLSQSSVPIDLASAKAQIRRTGQQESHTRYLADPHSATHRTLTREASPQFHWRLGWSRSECITVALLRTGHSPLLASYYTELDDNSLHCVHTAEATTRRHSICSCAVRLACKHAPALTTPTHDAWWASWRRLGWWHVPLTGNERQRVVVRLSLNGFLVTDRGQTVLQSVLLPAACLPRNWNSLQELPAFAVNHRCCFHSSSCHTIVKHTWSLSVYFSRM